MQHGFHVEIEPPDRCQKVHTSEFETTDSPQRVGESTRGPPRMCRKWVYGIFEATGGREHDIFLRFPLPREEEGREYPAMGWNGFEDLSTTVQRKEIG